MTKKQLGKKAIILMGLLILIIAFIVAGCSSKPSENIESTSNNTWDEQLKTAKGTTVNFYMWGGDTRINKWVDEFMAAEVKNKYGVLLNRVPMDAADFMNKLANEKAAGKKEGSIDLLWINGENFYTAKENGLLYGPFADKLPNYAKYMNNEAPENKYDFGYPTEGYETPYGRAQLVFIYDSSKVPNPPKNLVELEAFIKRNPGKFTYPAPPDYTGSAFVRNIMYTKSGGYEQFMNMTKEELASKIDSTWEYFNSLKPFLWRGGKTYPANIGQLDSMYADGEVWMSMTYSPLKPAGDVMNGIFSKATKTFILEEGTISNTHFLAIPNNASNKAGAMAVADFMTSFEAQLSKLDPNNWGDLPVFDTAKLSEEEKKALASLNLGEATLEQSQLIEHRVPEIPAKLVPIIEEEWTKNVAKDK